jgi:Ca-activated chloride channel homolog
MLPTNSVDWDSPQLLLLALPLLAALLWWDMRSVHPMQGKRKSWLLVLRATAVLLALLALAGPARLTLTGRQAVVLVLDHSQSLGEKGLAEVLARASALRAALPAEVECSCVALGDEPALMTDVFPLQLTAARRDWQLLHGVRSDYAAALDFSRSLFPPGAARQIVVIGDGEETQGDMLLAAQRAAVSGVKLHVIPVAGERKPDARVRELVPSRSRLHEGATLTLTAFLDSTLDGNAAAKLYENGVEVERRSVQLVAGQETKLTFTRSPPVRDIYKYRVALDQVQGDTLPGNNDALALVDVRGRLRLLLCEGESGPAATPLVDAMQKEGIAITLKQPGSIPQTLAELAGFDAVILSDISARQVGEAAMRALHEYVEKLGGGLLMLGGPNSFGLGGFHATPIEEMLPVRLRAKDEEEKQTSALALVLDRSGSMVGEKLEMAKSAALAAAEVLSRNDFIGVYAFDSDAHVIVPMTRVTTVAAIAAPISTLASGGGTHLEPALQQARAALQKTKTKIKHIIILTDGQTTGGGYEITAGQCRAEGMTISTVAIGEGSHVALLQAIAASGGGQAYSTRDVSSISRIFTQDTLRHTGQMLREEPFYPKVNERHPLISGMEEWQSPSLAGYVKTTRRASAQLPLLTDSGDPLLAHWRYGLGKVTTFTSDAKGRWAGLWLAGWQGYSRFWSQVLRETAKPPQGQNMDLRLLRQGEHMVLQVDLSSDAATRTNAASVEAELYYLPADALGAAIRPAKKLSLKQVGPGLYEEEYLPAEAGVYMVRAQSGAESASAGFVHHINAEASMGTVQKERLLQAAQLTGGRVMKAGETPELQAEKALEHQELWPTFVLLLLLVFLVDVAARRWENVQGLWQWARGVR